MNMVFKTVLAVAALGPPGTFGGVNLAMAENVPDALSVEWEGNKPCEKLFEDAHVRMARCTFPPGGDARLPLTPGLPELCRERRPGTGPGRERNTQGQFRRGRTYRCASGSLA